MEDLTPSHSQIITVISIVKLSATNLHIFQTSDDHHFNLHRLLLKQNPEWLAVIIYLLRHKAAQKHTKHTLYKEKSVIKVIKSYELQQLTTLLSLLPRDLHLTATILG